MLKSDYKYLFITSIIEHLFGSIEIYLKVTSVKVHPLFIRFTTKISSSNDNKINWNYFFKELVYQIGCSFSDIDIEYVDSNSDSKTYNIDITRSAISHFEKGTSYGRPQIFEEKNIEWMFEKAIKLSLEDNFSPELIAKKLNMRQDSAKDLYEQLIKADMLIKKPRARRVN